MDIARRNYSTTARPFRDSETEVTIKWRRADPDAGTLPYPSRLCSLDWVTEPWRAEGVGEVYGEARTFLPKALPTFPPTDHICGTRQDHEEGGEYLPSLPPVTFREDGLPSCCGPMPEPEPEPEVCPLGVPTCELAPPGLVNELCDVLPAAVGETWRRWTAEVGVSYRLEMWNAAGTDCTWFAYTGDDCDSLTELANGYTGFPIYQSHEFTATHESVWLMWLSPGGAPPLVTVRLLELA